MTDTTVTPRDDGPAIRPDPRGGTGRTATRWTLRLFVVGYLVMLVGGPVIMVVARTFAGGIGPVLVAMRQPEVVFAFELTLSIAVWAVVLNTVFGVGVALLLTRYHFPGRRLLSVLVDLPLSVSPVVAGLALLLVYGDRSGWFGPGLQRLGLQIVFAPAGIVLATAFVSLPLVVREIVPVLTELGGEAEEAARSLGAGAWQIFWRITLPGIKWGVAYGVVLALARSLGEFGAVKIVSGGVAMRTQTATLLVEQRYQQFGQLNQTTAYVAALALAVVAILALVVVAVLRPERSRR